jgi:choline monooxygenase
MLPVELYQGDAPFKTDREGILRRTWQFVGHEAMAPNAGDYVADVVGGAPVVVVRKADGQLAAFHNVCRHRAGALVADGTGSCGHEFTCRYHGWRYTLDGRLRSATDFGAVPGFDPREFGLFPVRLEIWRGLLFVNLDEEAAPLAEMIRPLEERWDGQMPDFGLTDRRSHTIDCNWKTYVENYLEGYHLPAVHPEFDEDVVVADYEITIEGQCHFHKAPARDGSVNAGIWAWLWPNLAINTYRHGFMVERMTAMGPNETRLDYFYFFDPARRAELADMMVVSERVTGQDKQVCEEVQRNLNAGVYRGGMLSPKHEHGIAWFQTRVAQAHGVPSPPLLRTA